MTVIMRVAGVDEVGRGPLAGPVVAAAVILPPDWKKIIRRAKLPKGVRVTDSKLLTLKARETLYDIITSHCCHAIAEASVAEINEINIYHASLLAMRRALLGLAEEPHAVLVDGKGVPDYHKPCRAVVGGDLKHAEISAASIIAKVTRDRYMQQLAGQYPHYGWHSNVGYGTKVHWAALKEHGVTPHHRRRFVECLDVDMQSAAA